MSIGIDLVEHKDMENKDERFISRVLSLQERNYYQTITSSKRRVEYIASRFAAKEALVKCFQSRTFRFCDVSILNDENGAPYVQMEQNDRELQISLSHTDSYSVAVVISLP